MLHLGSGVKTQTADFQIAHEDERLGVMVWVNATCTDSPPPSGDRRTVSVEWRFKHHPLAELLLRSMLQERGMPHDDTRAYSLADALVSTAATHTFRTELRALDAEVKSVSTGNPRCVTVKHAFSGGTFAELVDSVQRDFTRTLDQVLTAWIAEHPIPAAR